MPTTQRKPWAVIISDIHFTPATLELATSAFRQAVSKACELKVPLIVAGDTLDSKAIIRGECANRLIELMSEAGDRLRVYVLVGNHDLINEKGKEHTLNFLRPYCEIVDCPKDYTASLGMWLIPYVNDASELELLLGKIQHGSTLIMHQGVQTAFMGHYVQDKTSLPKAAFADFRVISGHYHRAQNIKCGRPRKGAVGLFSYVGSPYTTSFAEAHDGEKGFQILYTDGLMELVPTNLRRHLVIECDYAALDEIRELASCEKPGPKDIVWMKVRGTYAELESLKKREIGMAYLGHTNFKLDKIYTDQAKLEASVQTMTDAEILDAVIDRTGETPEQKANLKALWRELLA